MTNTPRPWTVRASRALFGDRWLNVRADRCVTASGAVLDPYYVLHYPDWVYVLAITDDRRIVAIRQYRHAVGRVVLELPGGVMDADEDAATTALRELAEETGYHAPTARPVCAFPANPATHTNTIHTYLAEGAYLAGPPRREAGEDLDVVLLSPAELLENLRGGAFGQSMQAGGAILALEQSDLLHISLAR